MKEFVCTITGSPQYFINFIDGYNDILAQEDNTFKQNEPIQSLVGSLSYFIHEYVLLMSFAISVLSIYSRHPHGTVYHLLHCLVRKLYHMNLSLLFCQSRSDSDFLMYVVSLMLPICPQLILITKELLIHDMAYQYYSSSQLVKTKAVYDLQPMWN